MRILLILKPLYYKQITYYFLDTSTDNVTKIANSIKKIYCEKIYIYVCMYTYSCYIFNTICDCYYDKQSLYIEQ